MTAKSEALKKKKHHKHMYRKGECVHCGKEKNVEWEGKKGGDESGKEDGE